MWGCLCVVCVFIDQGRVCAWLLHAYMPRLYSLNLFKQQFVIKEMFLVCDRFVYALCCVAVLANNYSEHNAACWYK
jgi:hypothetical protein